MQEDFDRCQQEKAQDILPTDEKLQKQPVKEIGGIKGPEPTRYGDWEKNGRCVDF